MTNQSAEHVTPVRACCGQSHHGPVCPDGRVMCQMCFLRFEPTDLHVIEKGDGNNPESAPICEDVCRTCKKREDRWGQSRTRPGKGTSDA